MIKLSIILPIWGQLKIIRNCFDSLYRNWQNNYELIVIDDNSDKRTNAYLQSQIRRFNNSKFIENTSGSQLYFTKSILKGIANCDSNSEYLLLLNSDTIITKDAIPLMLETFSFDPKIAAAGSTTSSTASEQQDNFAFQNRFNWWNDYNKIEDYAKTLEKKFGNEIQDIDLVGGFAIMVDRQKYNEIGGFDPNLQDYGGEKELQIRLRNYGYRTVWRKAAYIHHLGRMSYSQDKKIDIGKSQKQGDQYIINKLKNQ